MFLFKSVNAVVLAMPSAPTADQLQPWMIAAIAAGALLALLLLIFAARKSRSKKHGEEIREAMSGAKQDMQNTGEVWKDFEPIVPEGASDDIAPAAPVAPVATQPKASGGKKSLGKHAK